MKRLARPRAGLPENFSVISVLSSRRGQHAVLVHLRRAASGQGMKAVPMAACAPERERRRDAGAIHDSARRDHGRLHAAHDRRTRANVPVIESSRIAQIAAAVAARPRRPARR